MALDRNTNTVTVDIKSSQIRVLGPLGIHEKVFSRIRKFVAVSQVPPLVRNPQMNGFQMLIGNLRGLDFGFGSLPPTVCSGFQKLPLINSTKITAAAFAGRQGAA